MGSVEAAAHQIGEAVRGQAEPHVLVRSTVVPATTDGLVGRAVDWASRRRVGGNLGLAMNPEFLRVANPVEDFADPDRSAPFVADPPSGARRTAKAF